jgi:hypothetical protein
MTANHISDHVVLGGVGGPINRDRHSTPTEVRTTR